MLGGVIRFIVSAIVLLLVSFVVPSFNVAGFWGAIAASLVIVVLSYLIELLFGKSMSPYGRGIAGFIMSAIVLYLSQFFVSSISMSFLGALLAALVIGIVDAVVPTQFR